MGTRQEAGASGSSQPVQVAFGRGKKGREPAPCAVSLAEEVPQGPEKIRRWWVISIDDQETISKVREESIRKKEKGGKNREPRYSRE